MAFKVGLTSSVESLRKHPHRHTQRYVSNPVRLTKIYEHHIQQVSGAQGTESFGEIESLVFFPNVCFSFNFYFLSFMNPLWLHYLSLELLLEMVGFVFLFCFVIGAGRVFHSFTPRASAEDCLHAQSNNKPLCQEPFLTISLPTPLSCCSFQGLF